MAQIFRNGREPVEGVGCPSKSDGLAWEELGIKGTSAATEKDFGGLGKSVVKEVDEGVKVISFQIGESNLNRSFSVVVVF